MSQFDVFGRAVRARFKELSGEMLFVVNSDRDLIWQKYLASFPAGSDPMFRKRTEHDCGCCRHFIRDIGNVVAIQNGALSTIWDLSGLPEHYQAVADNMAAYVKSLDIRDVYLTKRGGVHGTPNNRELGEDKSVINWTHFSAEIPSNFVTPDVAEKQGDLRTSFEVLKRGLQEFKIEALATVAGLIEENALYRGAEHKRAVDEFHQLKLRYNSTPPEKQDFLIWTMVLKPVARFKNTAIGTLVQDLSEGRDEDEAVKAFETKVAPANYKRPTALITKKMVDAAMKTVQDLGLEPALERRHARFEDMSVNSVLFVDNAVRTKMKDAAAGLKGLLMQEVKPVAFDKTKAEKITVEKFVNMVLPQTTSLEVYLEGSLLSNFVSLTAPVHADVEPLFKWNNNFAWSYDGNVTDSIKEKVKRAGGQVENVLLRASLAWYNHDDLDLHMWESQYHIYYGSKRSQYGYLDVDMNAVSGHTREPVENIRYAQRVPLGKHRVIVHQFRKRESSNVGFTAEIEVGGQLLTFRYPKAVRQGEQILVAELDVKEGTIKINPGPEVQAGELSQDKWGLKTLDRVKVNSVVVSPNHWDGKETGNKHWFFILEGCKNPQPVRGIYNEFLNAKLDKHRKVFEVLGDKTKCPVVDEQMSGVGFSSTRKDEVSVIATGPTHSKAYTVVF